MVPSSGSTIQRLCGERPTSTPLSSMSEAVVGPAALQLLLDHLLGAAVGGGDEVARPLDRDLELLDLAEIAGEQRAALVAARIMISRLAERAIR